jgi:predicted ArsR family transcriptional regulator
MQSIVAQSSTEAEYIASNDAVKETIWIRRIAKELGFPQKATKVHIDNLSARALASAQMTKTLTKHIRLRYHWVREQVAAGKVFLAYVNTKSNWADAMTKVQRVQLFMAFVGRYLTPEPKM